jgi:hypothetical protein
MHFQTKNILKNNYYHNTLQAHGLCVFFINVGRILANSWVFYSKKLKKKTEFYMIA